MLTIKYSMIEFLSYNSAFLASISNTVLKGSGKENYSNIQYVKMTTVELLNFSADKFSFSPFLAVVALANVIRAPVNGFCNAGVDVRLLSLYNCCIKPETEENPEIFLFWLSSSSNPSNLDHFVHLMKESFVSQRSEGSLSRPVLDDTDTWLLESRVHTGKKAKVGGKKPSDSKLPKTDINMPGTSSILSGCEKTKG